jgi:gliding motility-associated-like protein
MRNYLFLFLLFLCAFSIKAQKETDNWYFGSRTGLNFSNLSPTIINNGKMLALAGCATISDKNGKLLLYTNGKTIWNKNHFTINPGGTTPFSAGGNTEAVQNSIIIPLPKSEDIYYVFTTSAENDETGLYYNIVDFSSGLAKVLGYKRKLLDNATGKISAVHHKDGESIWIVTIGSQPKASEIKYDTFFSYKIDLNGLDSSPITSSTEREFIEPKGGALKISPNGELIAAVNNTTGIELYNFNSTNGKVNNKKHITVMGPPPGFNNPGIPSLYTYGLEFSQDSKFLYTTTIYNDLNGTDKMFEFLLQYNLEDLSKLILDKSIISDTENYYNSLQIASNGKIYKTNTLGSNLGNPTNYLSVINQPTKEGRLSAFQEKTVEFNSQNVMSGLPNFIQSYFRTRIIANDTCLNSDVMFSVDTYAEITNIEWDFGDGNTSTEMAPIHTYNSVGAFNARVKITINNREIIKTKEINVFQLPELKINQNLEQCDIDLDGLSTFNLNNIAEKISTNSFDETFIFYKKLEDAEKNINEIETPENFNNTIQNQEIFVRVINQNDCYSITSFNIKASFVDIGAISDMITCENSDNIIGNNQGYFKLKVKLELIKKELNIPKEDKLRLYPSQIEAQTTTNEIDLVFISQSTTIWLRIDTDKGCGGITPIKLVVNSTPIINLDDNYTICAVPTAHSPIFLDGNSFNDRYEWRNSADQIISTNKDFLLNSIGTFNLTAYKTENGLECSSYKEFTVAYPKSAEFNQIIVDTETENNTINVTLNGDSNYEFSLDNITFFGDGTDYTFNNVTPGLRTIYVKDTNNCEPSLQTNISVIGFKNHFTPNGDGENDYWNLKGLDAAFFKSIKIIVFDRYGKVLHSITDFNSLGWDGNYNGKVLGSNSYWFMAEIIDLENHLIKKSGNFSLIRN